MTVTMGIVLAIVTALLAVCTAKAPRLTSVIWWAFAACILGCAALTVVLPWPLRERLLWFAFFLPFIWVALQFWCYWDGKPWRVTASLIAICITSSLVLWLSEPIV